MTSDRILRLIGVASLLIFLDWPAASQDAAGYGCPMHPEQRATAQGTCPLCGMALLRMGPEAAAPYRVTVETAPRAARSPVRLTPDAVLTQVVDGIRFELKLSPPQVAAGKASALIYRLSDAHTGVAVTDLTPYLGAWGHTLILSEDAERYVHCHPTRMLPEGFLLYTSDAADEL